MTCERVLVELIKWNSESLPGGHIGGSSNEVCCLLLDNGVIILEK